jgi:hypothetical protein
MLSIEPCRTIPLNTIDAPLYDDAQAALSAVVQSAQEPTAEVLNQIQALAEGMPLLEGRTLLYAELSRERLAGTDISARDRQAIESVFFEHPAFVVVADPPILFINQQEIAGREGGKPEVLHHELVHAEQAIRGDSRLTEAGQVWKGRLYGNDELHEVNQGLRHRHPEAMYRYLCLPWEEEAFRRSEGDAAYENKRMDAAIRLLFHNLQEARLVDHDPFQPEDHRVAFLLMCGEALDRASESSVLSAETFEAYDGVLADLHIGINKAGVSALRKLVQASIQKGGHDVPFPIERTGRDASIHLYLACLVRLFVEQSRTAGSDAVGNGQ